MADVFSIYCHTCTITGKKYVGQTKRTMLARWGVHRRIASYCSTNSPFHAAIRKYGAGCWAHELLETLTSQGDANTAEERWIDALKCLSPDGYNLRDGGKPGACHATTRERLSSAKRKDHASKSAEQRSEIIRKGHAAREPEAKSAWGRRMREIQLKRTTPEERSEFGRRSAMARSPEEQRESLLRARAVWQTLSTPEQKTERARKAWVTRRAKATAKAAAE